MPPTLNILQAQTPDFTKVLMLLEDLDWVEIDPTLFGRSRTMKELYSWRMMRRIEMKGLDCCRSLDHDGRAKTEEGGQVMELHLNHSKILL
jgi:hypothetical protein